MVDFNGTYPLDNRYMENRPPFATVFWEKRGILQEMIEFDDENCVNWTPCGGVLTIGGVQKGTVLLRKENQCV